MKKYTSFIRGIGCTIHWRQISFHLESALMERFLEDAGNLFIREGLYLLLFSSGLMHQCLNWVFPSSIYSTKATVKWRKTIFMSWFGDLPSKYKMKKEIPNRPVWKNYCSRLLIHLTKKILFGPPIPQFVATMLHIISVFWSRFFSNWQIPMDFSHNIPQDAREILTLRSTDLCFSLWMICIF